MLDSGESISEFVGRATVVKRKNQAEIRRSVFAVALSPLKKQSVQVVAFPPRW